MTTAEVKLIAYRHCYRDEIYIAPSGVQKERILPEDMFVQTINNKDLDGPPPEKKLKKSQCTPLFMNAYTMRSKMVVVNMLPPSLHAHTEQMGGGGGACWTHHVYLSVCPSSEPLSLL